MKYNKTVPLKDGRLCVLRSGTAQDGPALLDIFLRTHAQTDFLSSYPDENDFTVEQEAAFLQRMEDSENGLELLAEVDGTVVGSAGISALGSKTKTRHRARFGISVDEACWRLGIGRALTQACIECARAAGYAQLELDVVGDNTAALSLYKSVGFVEYGRNPRGFRSRQSGWQTLVLMRLELEE